MADKVDYQSAAIAALTAAEAEAPPEAPAAEAAAEPVEPVEGDEPAAEGTPPADPVKAEAPPAEPAKKDATKTWADVAREKAANRAAKAELAADRAKISRAEALLAAAESGDAMGLLAAAKIPWSAAAKQVIEGGKTDPKTDEKQPVNLEQEVAELKAEIRAGKAEKQMNAVLGQIKEKAGKYKYVSGLEAEKDVFDYLKAYHAETGEMPGDNLEESIEIACEAVELHLSKSGERWKKVLTDPGSGDKKDLKSASPSGTASKQAARTLTNDVGSGPRGSDPAKPKVLKTEDDYRSAALAAFLAQSPE
jgi:hypothetical protein